MIRWFEKKRFFSILMTFLVAIEIFFFSTLQGGSIGSTSFLTLVYHFAVFFLFSFFLFVSIKGNEKIKINQIVLVLIVSIVYSFLDEFHQMFVPSRDANIRDIITNNTGILLSTFIYSYINLKKK